MLQFTHILNPGETWFAREPRFIGMREDVLGPHGPPLELKPVMSLHTRVIFLKDVPNGAFLGYGKSFRTNRPSRIATLPIGYADGLRRALGNVGNAIVRGKLAPIVGRINMDLTLVDVTDVDHPEVGDEVLLIGRVGGVRISAEEMARQAGTISYEVLCGISDRVPRVYRDSTPLLPQV